METVSVSSASSKYIQKETLTSNVISRSTSLSMSNPLRERWVEGETWCHPREIERWWLQRTRASPTGTSLKCSTFLCRRTTRCSTNWEFTFSSWRTATWRLIIFRWRLEAQTLSKWFSTRTTASSEIVFNRWLCSSSRPRRSQEVLSTHKALMTLRWNQKTTSRAHLITGTQGEETKEAWACQRCCTARCTSMTKTYCTWTELHFTCSVK